MSVPDKAMKLKDGKIIADQLSSMIAVQFVQATANAAGSYVVYNGEVFYLPDGHTAGTAWANTTKEGPTNIGERLSDVKNAIEGKASAIVAGTDKKETHTGLSDVKSIVFHGNSNAFKNARYINSKNYLPNVYRTTTAYDVAIEADGHFVIYNGKASERENTFIIDKKLLDEPIPAGNYKWRIELTSRMSSYTRFQLFLGYESAPDTRSAAVDQWIGEDAQTVFEFPFTATEKVVKIGYKVGVMKDQEYSNYRIYLGIYDANSVIVDTEQTVQSDGTMTYTIADGSNLSVISTMQHESVINHIADTKQYVDDHTPDIIGYWNDNVYALPEKFGAFGDGVTDDTTALTNCIAYSATSGKPVRGYGKYKTTSTLLINTRYQDVYLRYILYTGNGAAIQLSERNITFGFDVIESSGIGILFQRYSNQSCAYHTINGNSIKSSGDCIKASAVTYYNTVNVRYLSSTSGNCIMFDYTTPGTDQPSEYVFRDCTCECNNGWVGYKLWGSKCYNFTIEANCHNGFLDPINCSFFGCRHREFVDAVVRRIFDGDAGKTNGPLFKFTMSPSFLGTHGMKYITADSIPWHSIDVSDIQGYDEITYQSKDDADEWLKYAYNGQDVGVPIRNINKHICETIGEKLLFIGNNKVYVPNGRTKIILNKAEYDMTLFEGQTDSDIQDAHDQGGWGTDFVTGYSHTDYYMNASFGAIGYNDLTITQQNGNTCTFYDKHGNVLFDGTNEGNGKWSLKCAINRESTGRLKNAPVFMPEDWWCYDGTNEIWEIVKIE